MPQGVTIAGLGAGFAFDLNGMDGSDMREFLSVIS